MMNPGSIYHGGWYGYPRQFGFGLPFFGGFLGGLALGSLAGPGFYGPYPYYPGFYGYPYFF